MCEHGTWVYPLEGPPALKHHSREDLVQKGCLPRAQIPSEDGDGHSVALWRHNEEGLGGKN